MCVHVRVCLSSHDSGNTPLPIVMNSESMYLEQRRNYQYERIFFHLFEYGGHFVDLFHSYVRPVRSNVHRTTIIKIFYSLLETLLLFLLCEVFQKAIMNWGEC